MMGITLAIGLLVIAIGFFVAAKRKWIDDDNITLGANIAGIVALLAAVAMFIISPPGPQPTLTITSTPSQVLQPTPTIATPPRQYPQIGLGETVTGTVYFNEGDSWIFRDGPATVNITLDFGSWGDGLIIVNDPNGVQREEVNSSFGKGEDRLLNFLIPDDGDYEIFVRNVENKQADYTLTVVIAE